LQCGGKRSATPLWISDFGIWNLEFGFADLWILDPESGTEERSGHLLVVSNVLWLSEGYRYQVGKGGLPPPVRIA
jgi:hypothetical protein